MNSKNGQDHVDLDERSFRFEVRTEEQISGGDVVVVRDVEVVGDRLRVTALTERALREEVDKLFAK
jgi:hypothetical protein